MRRSLWVGTRKGLFQYVCQGSQWEIQQSAFLGTQVTFVYASANHQDLVVSLKHGHFGAKVHRSNDGGSTWQEVQTPAYPPKPPEVADVIDPMRNIAIPWSLDMIWAIEQAPSGRLWCGTLPGGLFTSDDAGQSWQLNMPLWNLPNRARWFGGGYDFPGIHSIAIDPRQSDCVTIGISCGGVWRTTNNGRDWHCRSSGMRAEYMPPEQAFDPDIQDPHRLVQCPAQPDCFWVQHHNGIFRSIDDCQSWQEITSAKPSAFGFGVAVHPTDPQTAWFVPAVRDADRYPVDGQFVVTRTRDGGQSFDVLRTGLPQQHAYHLVYRHSIEIDAAGQTLAIGSTTGGLWISEDQGDSWTTITQDLPPVYCLRWA
ncbi:MAG: exo-alpha-sialidase [Pirellulaceae bacterium]|nr:exo-alpha-sialidase [Pirellulaceae bacterium]